MRGESEDIAKSCCISPDCSESSLRVLTLPAPWGPVPACLSEPVSLLSLLSLSLFSFFLVSAALFRGQSATRWPIFPQARQPRSLGGAPSVSLFLSKKQACVDQMLSQFVSLKRFPSQYLNVSEASHMNRSPKHVPGFDKSFLDVEVHCNLMMKIEKPKY